MISHADIEEIISSARPLLDAEDTSVIVAHLPVLRERLEHLKTSFDSGVLHAIAIKTNPHPEMLAHIVRQGYGLEAASIEEVELALEAGASTSHIVFDSPVKTQLEIDRVSQMQGMLVNVNSIEELNRFPKTVKCILGIRINPQVHTGAPQMFDVSRNESKFGVALTDRDQIVQAALEYPVGALHIHSGSQMRDLEVQYGALRNLKSLADEINEKQPGKIKVLDIGGGLPTEELHEESAMRSYGAKVTALFGHSSYQLVTEFGQWVHAEAGLALSRVEYVLDQKRIFIHLGADFFMRDAYTTPRDFDLNVWNDDGAAVQGESSKFDIAGPLCFAGDYLAHQVPLPSKIQEGMWLSISNTGANTYALWSRHCSRKVPKYLSWDGESTTIWSNRTTINY